MRRVFSPHDSVVQFLSMNFEDTNTLPWCQTVGHAWALYISTFAQKGCLEEHANKLDDKNQMPRTRQNRLNYRKYYKGVVACLAIIAPDLWEGEATASSLVLFLGILSCAAPIWKASGVLSKSLPPSSASLWKAGSAQGWKSLLFIFFPCCQVRHRFWH